MLSGETDGMCSLKDLHLQQEDHKRKTGDDAIIQDSFGAS